MAVLPITILGAEEGGRLAKDLRLPFPILCDQGHDAVQDYRMGECSTMPSHVCFVTVTKVVRPTMLVIDTSGIIRFKQQLSHNSSDPDNQTLLHACKDSMD